MGSVHQHFRKEEHQFIDKILDYKNRVEDTYVNVVCHFLTPRQLKVASALFSKDDTVNWYESPLLTERKRAVISHYQPNSDEFEEVILNIVYPSKFHQLKHSSILGAVLNAGVKRDYIGDVVTDGDNWQIIVSKSIAHFLCQEIQSIGRAKVTLKPASQLIKSVETSEQKDTLVASLRLDAVVSEAFRLSRSKAKALIEAGQVSLNWAVCERSEKEVCEMDIISVRGYGRTSIRQINGLTQRGKIKITLAQQVHRKG